MHYNEPLVIVEAGGALFNTSLPHQVPYICCGPGGGRRWTNLSESSCRYKSARCTAETLGPGRWR
eukprot:8667165-Pyramimonas_sp.AAC.1